MEKPTGNGTPSKSGNTKSVIDNVFDAFMTANRLGDILKYYVRLCQLLDLKADKFCTFYNKLKSSIKTWRAAALWKKIDQRARCVSYGDNTICSKTNVLIIGAGPCGLRTAIEAQLLGAKVVVVEKRDRFSRNNVLHLWPFVIEDLKKLGVKKLLGTFCAGSINHISIRQLQCVLVKICLVLGVELHVNTAFEKLITPTSQSGWRAQFKQDDHRLSNYEFDVVVGGFGKKPDVLPGFKRTEFRGKLAIAITANFENRHTEAENVVGEISGVSRIYKPKFFDNLNACTGIDLENIVYYKDDTHYFIMTAKKSSLLKKGVIKRDLQGVQQLLSSNNVDNEALLSYAREAAGFSTNYAFENLPFALNHRNEPDVALFDFTCMHQAESASRIITRNGCKLLCMLVGDSLLEPFWPTGSGCAKGFLSSLDTAWTIREWSTNKLSVFEVLIERESIYHLLPASTAANLHKDLKSYTIDPRTRYINLKKNALTTAQVRHLYDSDEDIYARREPQNVETSESNAMRGDLLAKCQLLAEWISEVLGEDFDVSSLDESKIMCAILHRFRPDLVDYNSTKIFDAESSTINYTLLQQQLGFLPPTAEEVSCFDSNLNLLLLYKMYQQYKDYNPTKDKLGGSTPKAIVNGHVPNGAGDQPKSILVRCHKKRHVCICKKRKEQTKLFDLRPICSDMFNIMKETVVTAFILFAMDFICNAEQYGFNNVFNIFVT